MDPEDFWNSDDEIIEIRKSELKEQRTLMYIMGCVTGLFVALFGTALALWLMGVTGVEFG